MEDLVFATGNPHKIREVNELLEQRFKIEDLQSIGCREDIPETSATIAGNALQKAAYVYEHYGRDCFAEDTGLEVDALNGEPGVFSARYAGPEKNPQANTALLLKKMADQPNRAAQFRTFVALILGGEAFLFEGVIRGSIAQQPRGNQGFGYDPVFVPEGRQQSFAEMPAAEKNAISHRGRAMRKLRDFLLKRQED